MLRDFCLERLHRFCTQFFYQLQEDKREKERERERERERVDVRAVSKIKV